MIKTTSRQAYGWQIAFVLAACSNCAIMADSCVANDLAIYTVAPRFGSPVPSELHRFADNGDFIQRWNAPETLYGASMTTDGSSLYVAELGGAIERYSLEGVYLGQFADVAQQAGDNPGTPSLESDNAGNLFVSYSGNRDRVSFRLDAQGAISGTFSHPMLTSPLGIDAAADGSVYIVNANAPTGDRLFKFDAQGGYLADVPLPQFGSPSDLAIHETSDELFIADESGESIHVYDISTPAPTYRGPIAVPQFVTEISIEPTSGRIFGTAFFEASAFEVSRSGDLLTTFVPIPSGRAIRAVVAVAVAEPSARMGTLLVYFGLLLTRCWRRERCWAT